MNFIKLKNSHYHKLSKMKNRLFILPVSYLFISIAGCQGNVQQNQSNTKCPSQSKVALTKNDVEKIVLDSNDNSKTGMAGVNRPIAYSFLGKKGQKFNYKTTNDLCIWLYSPELKLLDNNILPEDGQYFLQASPAEGSGTFELKMSLGGNNGSTESKTSPSSSSNATASTPSTNSDRLSPEQAMINHYQVINNGNLNEAWSDLTTQFQGTDLVKGKREFDEWWNSVRSTSVGQITVISSSEDRAVVKVNLVYTLKQGRVFRDPRDKLKLVWDGNAKKWLINGKYQ